MDADAQLVRRTAVRVGVWITVAVSVLVLAVLAAAFTFVFTQIPLGDLFASTTHEETVDVGGQDVIVAAVVLGVLAIVMAGTLGLLTTRRAVAPLVEALGRQRRFVADASHELRTPLAVLDARLQVLERSLPRTDPHRELAAQLRVDSHHVINVVNDLLDSVDLTATGDAHPVPLEPIIEGAVAAMQILGDDRGVGVRGSIDHADLAVAIPEASLHRSLVALIDNAIRHSPPGGVVTVAGSAERRKVLIAVSDHGAGIQGIAADRIFDRFARSSPAVDGGGSATGGFGIGLSLVQDTVGRFGGTVAVTRTSAEGTSITIRLPRVRR